MSKNRFRPIILAGGSGKRLWPLSTTERPKQFIPLFAEYSLFDLTLQRLNKESIFKKPIVVTSADYKKYVEDSIERTGVEPELIILEPSSRNTFPAIMYAVLVQQLKNKDEIFFITPSDHHIARNRDFHNSCTNILELQGKDGLTLFGVKPDRPSSEYGYILSKDLNHTINPIKLFIEKPEIREAEKLMSEKGVLWNAGIFAFTGSWFLESCKKINPKEMNKVVDILPKKFPESLFLKPDTKGFSKLRNSSFDKSFTENNNKNYVTVLEAGWADLGSWYALNSLKTDPDSEMTLFKSAIEREERPWGFFETLMETDKSKVKLLSVNPGQKLSLQKHLHRSETWYVVSGQAKVTKGNQRFSLVSGDSVIIDKNEEHRLENSSNKALEIIEIQSGTYFGEDDIVRIEDSYGRADLH